MWTFQLLGNIQCGGVQNFQLFKNTTWIVQEFTTWVGPKFSNYWKISFGWGQILPPGWGPNFPIIGKSHLDGTQCFPIIGKSHLDGAHVFSNYWNIITGSGPMFSNNWKISRVELKFSNYWKIPPVWRQVFPIIGKSHFQLLENLTCMGPDMFPKIGKYHMDGPQSFPIIGKSHADGAQSFSKYWKISPRWGPRFSPTYDNLAWMLPMCCKFCRISHVCDTNCFPNLGNTTCLWAHCS